MSSALANNYRLLIESIVDYAIYMLDVNGHVVSWNLGAERCKGYKESEAIGMHFSRFYTEEDRAAGVPAFALERAVEDGRFEAEGWRVRKNGSLFWAHVLIDPIRDDAGDLVGFAKVTRDLTERKAAEERKREDQAQFKMLVQGVTDYAIFLLDPTGHVSSWNPGAQRIKGYGQDEIIGRHFSCFYTAGDQQNGEPERNLHIAFSTGRAESEGWRVRKDGSRFWAHVLIDRILDDQGNLAGFAKVTRDVTEQRRTAEELDRARETLFQSQKLESIGQLTGGVAHDFNNLLMTIIASLELIGRRVPDDPKLHTLLENAKAGALRGAALTERMLSFARKQELRPVPVNLVELVGGMSNLLQRSLGSHIAITTTFPMFLGQVFADHNQLELALMNLLVNARDAIPEGGEITISAQKEAVGPGHFTKLPEGDFIKLVVADQGEGMDEATLARATEPFFTTKGVGKGTGLGLSMVHGLAEQSGGRLIVRSQRGEGKGVKRNEPTPYSRRGPAPAALPKPEVVHHGGSTDLGGNTHGGILSLSPQGFLSESHGTSYAAPLVASLSAQVWSELVLANRKPSPSLVKAIMVHSAAVHAPPRSAAELHYFGFGMPQGIHETLMCTDDMFTTFHTVYIPRGQEIHHAYPIPACLLKNEKFCGEIIITLCYDPLLNSAAGAEYCRSNVSVSMGSKLMGKDGKIHFKGSVPPDPKNHSDAYESTLIEHGFKWSPLKVYRRRFLGVAGTDWELRFDVLYRAGQEVPPLPHEAHAIVTMRALEEGQPVYRDGVRALQRLNHRTQPLVTQAQIQVRPQGRVP